MLRRRSRPTDVVVCAAGSLPGDLHKLWRARDPKGYHLEYGYSCMGYEIAGGLGVKMAAPDRGVYVMVGDGSYLMMAQEIVTAIQEGIAITIVLLDNHGFASIGGLSESVGCDGFGTRYRHRAPATGELDGAAAAGRFRGERRIARRAGIRAGTLDAVSRRAGRRATGPGADRPLSCRSIASRGSAATSRGGMCRWRKFRRSTTCREARAASEQARERSATSCNPRAGGQARARPGGADEASPTDRSSQPHHEGAPCRRRDLHQSYV